MDKDKLARGLFMHIQANAVGQIERLFRSTKNNKKDIRDLLLNELTITPLLDSVFTGNVLIFKLLQCEINSITPAHYAALIGQTDTLVAFCEYIEADTALESGSTLLHLASFGGNMGTVKLLLDVYQAKPQLRDKYGWTALHYASTEGHLHVVKTLIEHGIDINVRDKDGTCAALRAKWHGHELVVDYFCKIGDEDLLLNINVDDAADTQDPLYAQVHKKGQKTNQTKEKAGKNDHKMRRESNVEHTGHVPSIKKNVDKFSTLPARFKQKDHESVRRIIRQNLELAFSDYEVPVGEAVSQGLVDGQELKSAGVGVHTMTKLMREELQKYRDEVIIPGTISSQNSVQSDSQYGDEEDPYMTLGSAPPIPSQASSTTSSYQPHPPPLPPRNSVRPNEGEQDYVRVDPNARIHPSTGKVGLNQHPKIESAALNAATEKLGRLLGNDWKKLARALPIDTDTRRLEARIKNIEKQHLGDVDRQAEMSLIEWKINMGDGADVDGLILALRSCGFHDKIEAVERATQEFTA